MLRSYDSVDVGKVEHTSTRLFGVPGRGSVTNTNITKTSSTVSYEQEACLNSCISWTLNPGLDVTIIDIFVL